MQSSVQMFEPFRDQNSHFFELILHDFSSSLIRSKVLLLRSFSFLNILMTRCNSVQNKGLKRPFLATCYTKSSTYLNIISLF